MKTGRDWSDRATSQGVPVTTGSWKRQGKHSLAENLVGGNPADRRWNHPGAPGWLSPLGIQLQLRSWSRGLWVQALHRALCWQLSAWSLLRILCLPLSLPLLTHAVCVCVSLSLSEINIKKIKIKIKINKMKQSTLSILKDLRVKIIQGGMTWETKVEGNEKWN